MMPFSAVSFSLHIPEDFMFSICFSSTPWHSLHNQLRDALTMKHAMNSEEYDQMVKGFEFERPIWKTKLGLSNFSSMDHESFDIKLESFLRIFEIHQSCLGITNFNTF